MKIFAFIREFVREKGYAPTVGEIQKACHVSSNSLVNYHLEALEREGHIRRYAGVTRGIELIGLGRRGWPVPVLGTIAAGQPIAVPTEDTWRTVVEEMVEVPADMLPRNIHAYALRVKGKSMIDAFVDEGDIVVMEATPAAENGQMVAAWLTEEQKVTLKKVYYEPNRIRLQPANASMDPIYVDPKKVQVQGRVIAVLRKYEQGSSLRKEG